MKLWIVLAFGVACLATAAPGQTPPVGSSINPDEMAIYETVLGSWLGKQKGGQFINEELSAPPSKDDPEFTACAKELTFSAHKVQGQKSLVGAHFKRAGVELVDGSKWKPADPGAAIANGESVDAAVREGFAHSLISFSQVAFSRDGKDALVKFSIVCGGLCGSGSTIHLRKSAAGWLILGRCGDWVS